MTQPALQDLGPFITNSFGDHYLYSLNRRTFAEEKASDLFRRHFGDAFTKRDTLIVFIGTDSGLLLEYAASQPRIDGLRIVFVELPEVIERLAERGLPAAMPEHLSLCTRDEFWQQKESFDFDDYIFMRRFVLLASFAVTSAALPEYLDLNSALHQEMQVTFKDLADDVTRKEHLTPWIRNLVDLENSLSLLENAFAGRTAVVLGAGPSLDRLLPWVFANRDRLLIIAVARISGQLLQAGVIPHVIAAADPKEVTFDYAREMFLFEPAPLFFCANHVAPALLSQWHGTSVFLGALFPWVSQANTSYTFYIGSTVTNLALGMAAFVGCTTVIFGGVDFCFGRDGISHASGSFEAKAGPALLNTVPVTTNDGSTASTRVDYLQGRDRMEQQAAQISALGVRIINPAGGAARMKHVDYLPVEEIALSTPATAPEEIFARCIPEKTAETEAQHLRLVEEEVKKIISTVKAHKKQFASAQKLVDTIFSTKTGHSEAERAQRRLAAIEKQLGDDPTGSYNLLRHFNINALLAAKRAASAEQWSDDEKKNFRHNYYTGCRAGADAFLAVLHDAEKACRLRREEEKKRPDIKKLTRYWSEHNQNRRALLWRQRHPAVELDAPQSALVDRCTAAFNTLISSAGEEGVKFSRMHTGINGLENVALRHHRNGDKDALIRLKTGLEHHPQEEAALLAIFVGGLITELEERPEEAQQQYQKLIGDEVGFLTEEALHRILLLNLTRGNYEDALTAADCLSAISITYAPTLAELYTLGGDKNAALEVYTRFLQQIGVHIPTMLKMAELYTACGVAEGAVLMYETILEQDPENATARQFLEQQKK